MDAPSASVTAVAAEIRRRRPRIRKVRLHKLLYYVQGYHLAWQGEPAFFDDIEAWGSGPVVASLWHAEKRRVPGRRPPTDPLRESVRNILTNVLCRLGDKTGAELIAATHAEDPWLDATQGGTVIANQLIPHESLAEYFGTESPALKRMLKDLDVVRDDSPFVPDPPGALDALVAEISSR